MDEIIANSVGCEWTNSLSKYLDIFESISFLRIELELKSGLS